ncbi:MAG: DUF167 domain-containing protein [Acidobacteria bacterium]|nr:DUF167 domain-containing protein [Acidobacteriota bacterium]MCH8985106.1 DUF167 domain-containing protein [Acidobacteriota bacterium]
MAKVRITDHPDGTVIDVWVVPGASRTEVVGAHNAALKIRVAAPPEGGKASTAVRKILIQFFACDDATLIRGATSRRKQWLLTGIDRAAVVAILGPDKLRN